MNITENTKYSICYRGKCKPGFSRQQVCQNISDLFHVPVSEVVPIFSGETFFLKTHLNLAIAEQFVEAFSKAGAICEFRQEAIEKDTQKDPDINDYLLNCPKCGYRQVNGEECKRCGIVFHKLKDSPNTASAKMNRQKNNNHLDALNNLDFRESEWKPEKSRAILFIKYGTAALTGIFLIDAIARYFGIDIGLLPYLIGNIAIGYGGYLIAKTKGYDTHVALAGILGIIGVCIFVLLPDKTKKGEKYSWGLPELSSVLIFFIFLYFSGSYLVNSSHLSFSRYTEFVHDPKNFQEGRHYYPSRIPDSYENDYKRNISSVLEFTERGFELLSQDVLRPSEEKAVSDRMFEEISKLFVWMQYQQFLHMQLKISLPECLSQEKFKNTMKRFLDLFDFYLNSIGSPGEHRQLSISYLEWFHHCLEYDKTASICRNSGDHPVDKMMNYICTLEYDIFKREKYDDMIDLTYEQFTNLRGISRPPEDVFSLVEVDENGVFIFKTSPSMPEDIADKTFYMFRGLKPYQFEHSSVHRVYICIEGTLSQKYISSRHSVFDTWRNYLYSPD